MPKFRKKPVVIEAFEFVTGEQVHLDWPSWFREALCKEESEAGSARLASNGSISIRTLEGTMRADIGDYVIQGIKGELYPCKPDIFEATYEPVEAAASSW